MGLWDTLPSRAATGHNRTVWRPKTAWSRVHCTSEEAWVQEASPPHGPGSARQRFVPQRVPGFSASHERPRGGPRSRRRFFDQGDFLVREAVEFVHQRVDPPCPKRTIFSTRHQVMPCLPSRSCAAGSAAACRSRCAAAPRRTRSRAGTCTARSPASRSPAARAPAPSPGDCPGFSTTNALTIMPRSSSGAPTTPQSATAGCCNSAVSTSGPAML